jgi:hypothetical protein
MKIFILALLIIASIISAYNEGFNQGKVHGAQYIYKTIVFK